LHDADPFLDNLFDSFVRIEERFLLKVTDGIPFRKDGLPVKVLILPGKNAKQ